MNAMVEEYLRSIDKQMVLLTTAVEALQRSEERHDRDLFERSVAINNFIALYTSIHAPHRKQWLDMVDAPGFLRDACDKHDEYQESLGTGQSA